MLQSYTLNAYYDLNGFGHERRFRPYVGAGVGLQTSTLKGVRPSAFPFFGAGAEANKASTDPVITLEAGLSYLATDQAEFFIGGEYSFVDIFLLENTDFGNLAHANYELSATSDGVTGVVCGGYDNTIYQNDIEKFTIQTLGNATVGMQLTTGGTGGKALGTASSGNAS